MAHIVISDTSCLILFEKLGRWDILKATFGSIVVTEEVAAEYGVVPDWIEVKALESRELYFRLHLELGSGEASSIAFALEHENSVLIIDERKGRAKATELGIQIIGSLGTLLKAKEKGVIPSIKDLLFEIEKTDFRISEPIKLKLLKEAGENG